MEVNITSFFRKLEDDETRLGIEDTKIVQITSIYRSPSKYAPPWTKSNFSVSNYGPCSYRNY